MKERSSVDAEVEAVDEVRLGGVGDQELAVGVADVGGQLLAAAGRVHAHDHRSGESGGGQEEEVLGRVLQQDTDVERSGPAPLLEQCSPGAGFGDDLPPRPLPALEAEPDVVVLDPSHDEVAGDEGSISGHAEAGWATRPGP